MGFLHIHGEPQLAFQKLTTLITYGFSLLFCAFDNYDKIIGITTVSNRRLPLPALLNGNFTPDLDAVIPVFTILTRFLVELASIQIVIKLIEGNMGSG
jgi:hypothetical protein